MVKYVKRSIIFVLICAVVFSGIPVVHAQYYSDVSKSALTREEFDSIMYVSDNGIMVGSDTGEFMPNAYVNRAQFVQVLFSNSGEKTIIMQAQQTLRMSSKVHGIMMLYAGRMTEDWSVEQAVRHLTLRELLQRNERGIKA